MRNFFKNIFRSNTVVNTVIGSNKTQITGNQSGTCIINGKTFNGNNIIGWIDYNRYTVLSDRGNQTAFMNPYLTGFNLSPSPDDPYSSSRRTLRVQGTIYATCRGVIERTWYEGTF